MSVEEEINDQMNQVKQMLFNELEKSKNVVFDGLLEHSYLNKIPESLFVNYFLPCFLGKVENPNWVVEWISIAGSPMAELAVFKDGTDEVLYVVPSILNTNNLFLYKEDGDLGDIFNRYEQIKANIPSQGLNFLLNALNSKNEELISKINFNEVNRRWIDILKRYNLIDESQSASTEDKNEDYFEF